MPNNRPSSEWIEAAKLINNQFPITKIAALGEFDQNHASYIAMELGLKWHSPDTVLKVHNKYEMRKALNSAGLDNTPFMKIASTKDLMTFLGEVDFPVILKPIDGTASVNICQIAESNDIAQAIRLIKSTDCNESSGLMAEKMLMGYQYSVECFTEHMRHHIIGTTRKYSDKASFTEIGHISPGIEDSLIEVVSKYIEQVLTVLGVTFGPSHTEFVMTDHGPCIIETHLRAAGDEIPSLVTDVTGKDIDMLTVKQLFEDDISQDLYFENSSKLLNASAIWFFAPNVEGIFNHVVGLEALMQNPNIVEIVIKPQKGDEVHLLSSSYERIGWIRYHGESVENVIDNICAITRQVKFNIDIPNISKTNTI